jgi:hypothetical protein
MNDKYQENLQFKTCASRTVGNVFFSGKST